MTRRLLIALLATLWTVTAAPPAARAAEPVDLELILALDVSRSVDAEEMELQVLGTAAAFEDPRVIEAITRGPVGAIAVTVFVWADAHLQETVVPWTLVDSEASARALAARIRAMPRRSWLYTSISAAIDYGVGRFGQGFEGTRRVMDISGDGVSNAGRPLSHARAAALEAGVTINGLAVVERSPGSWPASLPPLDLYYRENVIGGPGAFLVVAEGFGAFEEAIRRKLVREIAMSWPENDPTVIRIAGTQPLR
jgi:hypothetical protein